MSNELQTAQQIIRRKAKRIERARTMVVDLGIDISLSDISDEDKGTFSSSIERILPFLQNDDKEENNYNYDNANGYKPKIPTPIGIEVTLKSNITGREVKGTYSARELLQKGEDRLVEEMSECDCQSVGETNVVECNCFDEWNDYTLTVGDEH